MYENAINDLLCQAVRDTYDELMEIAKENNLSKIYFGEHDEIDIPWGRFEIMEKDSVAGKTCVIEDIDYISFCPSTNSIVIVSENGHSGYIDETWGDCVDVADICGRIYQAVAQIVNTGEFCGNEMN